MDIIAHVKSPGVGRGNPAVTQPLSPSELRNNQIQASRPLRVCLCNELTSALNQIYNSEKNRSKQMEELFDDAKLRCKSNQIRPDTRPDTPDLSKTDKLAFEGVFPKILRTACKYYETGEPQVAMGEPDKGTASYVEAGENGLILIKPTDKEPKNKLMDLERKLRDLLPPQQITVPTIPQQHPRHPAIKTHYYQQPVHVPQQNQQPGYVPQQNQQPVHVPQQNQQPVYVPQQNQQPVPVPQQNQQPVYVPQQNQQPAYVSPQNQQPGYVPQQKQQPGYVPQQNQQQHQQPGNMQQQYPRVQPQPVMQQPGQAQFPPTGYPPTGYPQKSYPSGYPTRLLTPNSRRLKFYADPLPQTGEVIITFNQLLSDSTFRQLLSDSTLRYTYPHTSRQKII